MKNTTFYSAGAGSGKTYKITKEISRMIAESKGECRADQIILTTYTKDAANKLREDVRSMLYANGLYDAAIDIDNAAIGTIHSVAHQLVSRYWYLLGISANVAIMAEEDSKFYISQSLASLPDDNDLILFSYVQKAYNITKNENNKKVSNPDFWRNDLNNLITKTVEFCVTDKQLEEAHHKSKELINDIMGFSDHCDIDNKVVYRLKETAQQLLKEEKLAEGTKTEIEKVLPAITAYSGDEDLPIYHLLKLATEIAKTARARSKEIKEKYSADAAFALEIAEQIPRSVQIRNKINLYIDTIFNLALKWRVEYEEFKRKRCLLDYNDLLQKFNELLHNQSVVEDIRSRYKAVFVDEYQDCSPLLVNSFKRLSELVDRSVWVGDIKQAIYGFRGTNIELIRSVIDEVGKEQDGNRLDTLPDCWRSNKTIVDLVNNVYSKYVFKHLDKKFVTLGMPNRPEDNPAPQERELLHWHFDSQSARTNTIPGALAKQIKRLIDDGTFKPNEIAVIYKNNDHARSLAKELGRLGIAYNIRENDTNGRASDTNDISSFITAVVSYASHSSNTLSKAIIANRIEQGYDTATILTSRLKHLEANDSKGWLDNIDIFRRIADLRHVVGNQSVSAAVETIIVETNLCDLIKRIDPNAPAYNYCSKLKTAASTYESWCNNLGLSCTLIGFAEELKSKPISFPGDERGVTVTTYHKSKGLQWKCVILCALENTPIDPKKSLFGVLTVNTIDQTHLRFVPYALSNVCNDLGRFMENDYYKSLCTETINEAKHLMYVGMTRPKEQLILATFSKNDVDAWLTAIGCEAMDAQSDAEVIEWGGYKWNHTLFPYEAQDEILDNRLDEAPQFKALKLPESRGVHKPKCVSPSKVEGEDSTYEATKYATFAHRLTTKAGDGKDSTIGDFIHHAMYLWSGDRSILAPLAKEYGVEVDIDALESSITSFWRWMEQRYGKATATERELPFSYTNADGQVVTGEIDLVYHTNDGDVLVDYKTYQGNEAHLTDEGHKFHAGKYSGQIALYEEALRLRGDNIRERLICYLSLGTVIRFSPR